MLRKICNVPVFVPNIRDYDSHLIVCGLRPFPGLDVQLIIQGMQNYAALGGGEHLVFKENQKFLASSLETLAYYLLSSGKELYK